MAFFASNTALDNYLTWITQNTTAIAVMNVAPTSLSQCTASTGGAVLARATGLSSADFTGPSDDSTDTGRKISVNQLTTLAVLTTGVPSQIVLYCTAGTSGTTGFHFYTQCSTAQTLASTANSVTVPAWTITIADPTS